MSLVNQSGKEEYCNNFYAVTEYIPPIRDATISTEGAVAKGFFIPGRGAERKRMAPTDSGGGRTRFALTEFRFMASLLVHNYF